MMPVQPSTEVASVLYYFVEDAWVSSVSLLFGHDSVPVPFQVGEVFYSERQATHVHEAYTRSFSVIRFVPKCVLLEATALQSRPSDDCMNARATQAETHSRCWYLDAIETCPCSVILCQ